jgi:hypothetical protein
MGLAAGGQPAGPDEEVDDGRSDRDRVDRLRPPQALAVAALLYGGRGRSGFAKAGSVGHGV